MTELASQSSARIERRSFWAWACVAASLCLVYCPVLFGEVRAAWNSDGQGQSPMVVCLVVWQVWQRWADFRQVPADLGWQRLGWLLLFLGLAVYVIGHSQSTPTLEFGSVVPVIGGLLLLLKGPKGLHIMGLPLVFLALAIPLPDSWVNLLTGPMKKAVSIAVEVLLDWLQYPVSRTGVVLHVGPYQLLVADACAGIKTLFALEILGLAYLNMVKQESALRNVTLAALIIPISFTANCIRVLALCLITYHFGDEVGQGFLHEFSGLALFLSALFLTIGVDVALRRWVAYRERRGA